MQQSVAFEFGFQSGIFGTRFARCFDGPRQRLRCGSSHATRGKVPPKDIPTKTPIVRGGNERRGLVLGAVTPTSCLRENRLLSSSPDRHAMFDCCRMPTTQFGNATLVPVIYLATFAAYFYFNF